MKVICKKCKKLVDENEAIKITQYEFKSMQAERSNSGFFTSWDLEHQIYTQICIDCYKQDKW